MLFYYFAKKYDWKKPILRRIICTNIICTFQKQFEKLIARKWYSFFDDDCQGKSGLTRQMWSNCVKCWFISLYPYLLLRLLNFLSVYPHSLCVNFTNILRTSFFTKVEQVPRGVLSILGFYIFWWKDDSTITALKIIQVYRLNLVY